MMSPMTERSSSTLLLCLVKYMAHLKAFQKDEKKMLFALLIIYIVGIVFLN